MHDFFTKRGENVILSAFLASILVTSVQSVITIQTNLNYLYAEPVRTEVTSVSPEKSSGARSDGIVNKNDTQIFNQSGTDVGLESLTDNSSVFTKNEPNENRFPNRINDSDNTPNINSSILSSPKEIADFNGDGFSDVAIGVPEEDAELGVACADNLPINQISDSGNDGNVPSNILDNDLSTRWSSHGIGQSVTTDMESIKKICSVDLAWYKGNLRLYEFVISTSTDGTSFTDLLTRTSNGSTLNSEKYSIPSTDARYVRITVNGNNMNNWASITELDIFGLTSPSEILYDTGAVNIIYGSSNGLTPIASFAGNSGDNQIWMETGPELESDDRFGSALASGDFNNDGYSDLAIGKPKENVGIVADAGGVDVIYGSSAGLSSSTNPIQRWNQGVTGGVEQGDLFGHKLETGDFNNDGYSDLVVGVPSEDIGINGNVPNTGAINVIYGSSIGLSAYALSTGTGRDSQGFNQRSSEISSSANWAEIGDWFGSALAAGDFDADGYSDLAIGVSDKDVRTDVGIFNDAGQVIVMYGSSDGIHGIKLSTGIGKQHQIWSQNSEGIQDNPETGDRFGHALETGDFNSDGYSDLAIGAWEEKVGAIKFSGAVNVIYGTSFGLLSNGAGSEGGRDNQIWTQGYLDLVEDEAEEGDRFGSALVSGDFNKDGYSDLSIGVPYEDVGSNTDGAGAINLIYGSSKGLSASGLSPGNGRDDQLWTQNSTKIEGDAETGDLFGNSLAVGDFNKDGIVDLAIGVPGEDVGITAASAGAVNVIYGSKGSTIGTGGLSATVPFGGFGRADQLWTQGSPQIQDDAEASDRFGSAVS